ncbi:MAG: TIGR03826 family flagellar region protein [Bacilli bacterium]
MGELSNCPKCNALYLKTEVRRVCDACYKKEDEMYQMVYAFIRKKENRQATMSEVSEGTGVEEEVIVRFVRTGKLKVVAFPNLAYGCDGCGNPIQAGSLCDKCRKSIVQDLKVVQSEEVRQQELHRIRNKTYRLEE